jgi:FMN-dependent dehydrogenase
MQDVQASAANTPQMEPAAMDQPIRPPSRAPAPALSSAVESGLEMSRMDYKSALGVHHLGDLYAAARRRLPQAIFDYVEGGSYDEVSLRANREDLESLRFRQRVLVEVGSRSLGTSSPANGRACRSLWDQSDFPGSFVGVVKSRPLALPRPSASRIASACSLEEVAAQSSASFFFQLYLFKDRGVNITLLDRAKRRTAKRWC